LCYAFIIIMIIITVIFCVYCVYDFIVREINRKKIYSHASRCAWQLRDDDAAAAAENHNDIDRQSCCV